MERLCLDCGTSISGRVDKKFCSDQCRNYYNNNLNRDSNNQVRKINAILRKNRRIMLALNPSQNVTKVTKKQLVEEGFDFQYYTNIYTTKKGAVYYFCYEHGYLPLENDFFTLVVRNENRRPGKADGQKGGD